MDEKRCYYCGNKVKENEKFCAHCGKKTTNPYVCPYCNGTLKGDERFCPHCDSFLKGKEPVDMPKGAEIQYKTCLSCGKKVRQSAKQCPYCGELTDVIPREVKSSFGRANVFAIIGFIASFLNPILGMIFSRIGKNKVDETGTGGGLANWGIIISFIGILATVIALVFYFVAMMGMWQSY